MPRSADASAPLLTLAGVSVIDHRLGGHSLAIEVQHNPCHKTMESFFMPTVAEAFMELERLKHERAVWMEVAEFLSRFVDHEVSKADHKIKAEGCIRPEVSQKLISEFVDSINEQEIDPLNDRIQTLESLGVEEQEDDREEEGEANSRKESKKAAPRKAGGKARAKPERAKKRIRAVPRPTKPKASGSG